MRIDKICVDKLFGIFNHRIPLNASSNITIMHGPNGFGKTVLMRMVNGLFKTEYAVFGEIPFETFLIAFDTGDRLGVRNEPYVPIPTKEDIADDDEDPQDVAEFEIFYVAADSSEEETYRPKFSRTERMKLRRMVDNISDLERIGINRWFNTKTGDILTTQEAIEEFDLQAKLYREIEPLWLVDIKENIQTSFIQADRLLSNKATKRRRQYHDGREPASPSRYAVEDISDLITIHMGEATNNFAEVSQSIDRSFPVRVMGEGGIRDYDQDIYDRLNDLEVKRKELMRLGLLEKEEDDTDIRKLRSSQESLESSEKDLAKVFLSTHVRDIADKLSAFDSISQQLDLLTTIINERFKFKTLKVNKQSGIIVEPSIPTETPIPKTSLSSGEQHQLVLLYHLLFEVEPQWLVLIDEPELSLHVVWQRRFLEDLREIIKARGFNVLISTHSPQIIHDKWDWMVDLHNPEGDMDGKAD